MKNTFSQVLYITLEEELEYVSITAQMNRGAKRTDRIDKGVFQEKSLFLYEAVESLRLANSSGHSIIEEFGSQVQISFQALIQSADEIVFVVSPTLLRTPIDLLYHNGQPLFLKLPVSFRISPEPETHSMFNWPVSALIVSDITADPERAAKTVATRLDNSEYLDVSEVSLEYLRQQHEFDLLLMSVHGKVDGLSEDHIVLGCECAIVTDYSTIKPKLVYFDSCRLGASHKFLTGFSEMGTNYFVAPILSNEAGQSSTKTMLVFFKHLQQGERPEVALFHTRKELWDAYGNEEFALRVWRAFPFRIYRLN